MAWVATLLPKVHLSEYFTSSTVETPVWDCTDLFSALMDPEGKYIKQSSILETYSRISSTIHTPETVDANSLEISLIVLSDIDHSTVFVDAIQFESGALPQLSAPRAIPPPSDRFSTSNPPRPTIATGLHPRNYYPSPTSITKNLSLFAETVFSKSALPAPPALLPYTEKPATPPPLLCIPDPPAP